MKPRIYSDIRIRDGATVGEGGIPTLPVATFLFSVLHGVFRNNPGRFALGFPLMREGERRHPGHVFRVFAESEEDWKIVYEELDKHERIGSRIHLFREPLLIPENYSGPWIEYRRFRIPTRKSTQFRGEHKERIPRSSQGIDLRQKRIDASAEWPFFRLRSKTTGTIFSLHITKRNGERTDICCPDGYGLSGTTHSFSLPMGL